MEFLQNSNPLIFVLLLVILYTLFYLFKRDVRQSLLFLGIVFLVALLFSPGGQAIGDKTKYLSSPEARGECLLRALGSGGLWRPEASQSSFCQE